MRSINSEAKISKILLSFFQNEETLFSGILGGFQKFRINHSDYDKLRLIRYILGSIKGFKVFDQPIEKINWEIPFLYKKTRCSVSHEKFGFKIYIDSQLSIPDAKTLFKEIWIILKKSIELSENTVKEAALHSINAGNVIVHNRISDLEDKYRFFRDASQHATKQDESKNSYLNKKHARYYEEFAYISFYSLIEHICILTLAFTKHEIRNNLLSFTKLKWHEKYKIVFPLSNPEFKDFYDYFYELSKFRRNPTAHGYIDPLFTVFSFYYEPAKHRIPVNVYDGKIITRWHDKDKNLEKLDEFLNLIRTSKTTKNLMQYIDASFDICFDKLNLSEYEKINSFSCSELDRYIYAHTAMTDAYANMDW